MSLLELLTFKMLGSPVKAILFDLMGTCLDWHSSILPLLETSPPHPFLPTGSLSQLAMDWRAGFFGETHRRFEQQLPPEDIDVTHRRVPDRLLEDKGISAEKEGGKKKRESAWCRVGTYSEVGGANAPLAWFA